MSKKSIYTLIVVSVININALIAQTNKILLRTDFTGQVTEGAIDSLISEIKKGKEIRIGWQLDFDDDGHPDIEHWVDANFISILNGHVFNQITPIYRQIPKRALPQINITQSNTQWTGIIGTNGKLISRYIIPDLHLIKEEAVREKLEKRTKVKERLVATIWAIK
ncbi:MAG: hypothetical protein AAF990_16360 [Bacteroidota bacterium]